MKEPFTDEGSNNIISRVSTYDKSGFNGRALEMKLEERWKKLPKNILSFLKEISHWISSCKSSI